jgi:hypothetical protein
MVSNGTLMLRFGKEKSLRVMWSAQKGLLTSLYHLGGQQARITPISIVTEY